MVIRPFPNLLFVIGQREIIFKTATDFHSHFALKGKMTALLTFQDLCHSARSTRSVCSQQCLQPWACWLRTKKTRSRILMWAFVMRRLCRKSIIHSSMIEDLALAQLTQKAVGRGQHVCLQRHFAQAQQDKRLSNTYWRFFYMISVVIFTKQSYPLKHRNYNVSSVINSRV